MREIQLIKALQNRCEEALKDVWLPTKNENLPLKNPSKIEGFYMPEANSSLKEPETEEIAPFFLVRINKGKEIDYDKFQVKTEIIVQIYNDDKNMTGDRDLLLCMNRIRANILENQILEKVFIYDGGFSWQLSNDQPFPNWEMTITADWLIPNPQRTDYKEFT